MSDVATLGAITFPNYPASNRTPGVFADIDPSKANTTTINQRALIIGQTNPATATKPIAAGQYNSAQISTSINDAKAKYGSGSMLARMVAQYRGQDSFGEVWELPVSDGVSAAPGTGTVTITGTATEAGTLNLYMNGDLIQAGVANGDTAATVYATLMAVIATLPDLTASAAFSTIITFTSKINGVQKPIDLRLNYQGAIGGEKTPAGLTIAFANPAPGSVVPTLTTALANLGDQSFDFIVMPYNDATSIGALTAFLNDVTGRWSWQQMIYGHYFAAFLGTLGNAIAEGGSLNDQHGSIMAYQNAPEPIWIWAADITGACANSLRADPGVPLQYLKLNVKAPPLLSRFIRSQRNTLLYSGISTFFVNDAGDVIMERMVTLYQTNLAGAPDNSYLDVETMFSLMLLIRDLQIQLLSQFGRKKFVADGTLIPAFSNMVSPAVIKAAVVSRYRFQCSQGNAQQPDVFAKNCVVQNAGNGLAKILAPFILDNQLRQQAILVQFIKP